MSDTKSGDDKTLSVTPKKTLTLKRPGLEQGTVRQNFSRRSLSSMSTFTVRSLASIGKSPLPVMWEIPASTARCLANGGHPPAYLLIRLASSKSSAVSPPASWVASFTSTVL